MDVFDEIAAEMEAAGEQPEPLCDRTQGRCGTDVWEVSGRQRVAIWKRINGRVEQSPSLAEAA